MKHYESIIIGHITVDADTDYLGNKTKIEGGAVLYSSASAYALGHKVAALTKVAPQDTDRMKAFTLPAEDIYLISSKRSTDMMNQYLTPEKERRISACTSQGDPFTIADMPEGLSADIYHFAGLIVGDFDNDMMKALSKKGAIAVDVQACLRNRNDADGSLFFKDWSTKEEMLPFITHLKTDAAEAEIMTGLTDRKEAAKMLFGWGAKEIMITHNTEVLIYDGKDFYTCPIRSRNLSGRTGRGDTTFAAYINERLTHNIKDSLLYATATVSVKMETPGPYRGNRKDVEAYIAEFYQDCL
ncbi:MAG: PfkB family carbohydrate kinase [Eubacteriales bacterium]